MSTYVLIHGAWHDGGGWHEVASRLLGLGHRVYAPTLAGHGPGAHRDLTHDDCVRSVVELLTEHDLREVVLVGHSFGGTVIARVAEQAPDRIRRLVFHNAFVLAPGTCLLDDAPPPTREAFDTLASDSGDNTVMLPFEAWRETFIQDADITFARASYATLSPQPYALFQAKLALNRFYSLEIPTSYLYATDDIALPPGEWGWHPRMSGRLGAYRLVEMPGSHEVLFTNPELLADKIVEAGRD